jgi:hypothetical protein
VALACARGEEWVATFYSLGEQTSVPCLRCDGQAAWWETGTAGGRDRRAVGAGVGARRVARVGKGAARGPASRELRPMGPTAQARGHEGGGCRGRAATPRGWARGCTGAQGDMPSASRIHQFDRV